MSADDMVRTDEIVGADRPVAERHDAGGGPRVVLLTLSYKPGERVVNYIRDLTAAGVQVDLVVPDSSSLEEVEIDPRVRVRPIVQRESSLPVRRVEKAIIYRLPGGTLAVARRLAQRGRLRPVDSVLEVMERGHRKAAGAVHKRVFMPFYRQARPWLLARRAQRSLGELRLGTADRIVAADVSAVPLGWRLARQHPSVPATTNLERKPYIRPGSSPAAPTDPPATPGP